MTKLDQLDTVDVNNLGDEAICALLKWSMTTLASASTTFPKRGKRSDPAGRLLSTPASGTTTVASSVGTPNMDAVFCISFSWRGHNIHQCSRISRERQSGRFQLHLRVSPVPLSLVKTMKEENAVEQTTHLCGKLSNFFSLCHLLIFCSIVNKRYVGTSDYDH